MNAINTKAALFEIQAEFERGARFIYTDFFSNQYGRAACSAAFKEADLASRGYRKGAGVWVQK